MTIDPSESSSNTIASTHSSSGSGSGNSTLKSKAIRFELTDEGGDVGCVFEGEDVSSSKDCDYSEGQEDDDRNFGGGGRRLLLWLISGVFLLRMFLFLYCRFLRMIFIS